MVLVIAASLGIGCNKQDTADNTVASKRKTSAEAEATGAARTKGPLAGKAAPARGGAASGKLSATTPKMSPEDHRQAINAAAAMSRSALASFEREHDDGQHRLCTSSDPVPAVVPKAQIYTPSGLPATPKEFLTGDTKSGWRCLKFAMRSPLRCQFAYIAGGPYKSAKRGNTKAPKPDAPGAAPRGFEASAECDFDGDGVTSLYAFTGTVNAKGELVPAKGAFIDKQGE